MTNYSIITLLLIFIPLLINAQTTYELKWKIQPEEQLGYWTSMDVIDTAQIEAPYYMKALQDNPPKDGDIENFNFKDFFKSINEQLQDYSLITVLQQEPNWINIQTIREHFSDNAATDTLQNWFKGVQLRGLLQNDGDIQSFYSRRDQKNLLAIFFQLPSQAVQVGDKWSLELNWITMDHNFRCDSIQQINEVELLEVREENGEQIAVLKYTNHDYVEGVFTYTFSNEDVPSIYSMKYDAICEFSITKGRWKNYAGMARMTSSGHQVAAYKQQFTLVEAKAIPEKVLKYLD